MSNDIYTVATVFETRGQDAAEKALRDNEAATKAYEKATQTLNSRMKVSVNQSNKKAKTLGQLDSATRKAENEIKRLSVSVQQGAITSGQYQGRLNQISASLKKMGLENAQSRVMSYGRATREATATVKQHEAALKAEAIARGRATATVKQHEAALKAKAIAQGRTTTSTTRLTQATRQGAGASQAVRQQFLATANSIAVLDGPLGGVASRFSAFGVLIGRIGIPLAGLAIGLSAFTFAAQRAIREFAEWEKSLSTIENRLNSVGNQIDLTTQQISSLSQTIALETLASESQVLEAANSLLTFRNIGTEIFEDILRSAQDLAASGFGQVTDQTIRLAKALEDPRQGLTSLSRAGITFTRQQRQLVISLIDAGRQAEAYKIIMEGVERQVGGAGNAQANETLAGSFDTIGQGVRTATRAFGSWVAQLSLVEAAITRTANAAESFTRRQLLLNARTGDDAAEIILGFSVSAVRRDMMEIMRAVDEMGDAIGDTVASAFSDNMRGGRLVDMTDSDIVRLQELLAQLARDTVTELERAEGAVNGLMSALERRSQNLSDLQAQVDMQRELVGLTEEEARVQRILADLGFGGRANIRAEMEATAAAIERMADAGGDVTALTRRFSELEAELAEVGAAAKEMRQVFVDQQIAREINRIEESTQSTNESLRRQVEILEEARAAGNDALTVTEARRQADLEIQIQMIETQKQTYLAAEAAAVLAGRFDDAAEAAANVARMAALINELNEGIELQSRVADLGRTGRRGGGGGGGTDPNAEYQRELDALNNYLERRREEMMIAAGLERDLVMEQYEERFQTLQMALDRRLISEQEYADKVVALTQSREDRIREIEEASARARLGFISGIFGDMASAAQAGGDRLVKVQAALAFTQGMINARLAYTQALADPTIPSTLAKIGFAAKIFSLAAGAASQIKGSGGGRSAGGARTAAAPREAREATPQRVIIQGLDPNSLYTGEQLQNLFEAFYNENQNRGAVFVVNR